MEKAAYTFFQRQCAEYCSKIAAGGSFTVPRHLDDEPENFIERYLGSDIYIYSSLITENDKAYRARHTDEPSDYSSGYATLEEARQRCLKEMQTRTELVGVMTAEKVISEQGVEWIAQELHERLKTGAGDERHLSSQFLNFYGSDEMWDAVHAYAADAEFQIAEGNPPCFEIKKCHTASGHTEEIEIPEQFVIDLTDYKNSKETDQ